VPEGDTVHHAARRLGSALTGKALTRTDFRVPRLATTDLSGSAVMGVAARGKHLLFRVVGGHTLHTHFKMDGDWHLYRPTQRWRGPDHEVRAVLYTEERVAVGFRLGIVEVLPTAAEDSVVGHLGPDPLGPDWDPDEALRRIGADPERPVEDALLDQRVMAGPGNIYKCEVCFLRGVHPQTPVAAVADLPRLVALVHRLMEANRDTGRQITTGDTRRGMERWVYGRGGRPCRRCGTTILKRPQGIGGRERVTYWCPSCQPSMT
jgi:formamidopyrimidine-DNA glycosylase